MSIKGGVVNMLKDIRRRIFDSQTTLTFNLLAFVDNLPDENGKRPEIVFQLKKKIILLSTHRHGVPLSQPS